jgi:gliding motility-associated lipoprotein GldH
MVNKQIVQIIEIVEKRVMNNLVKYIFSLLIAALLAGCNSGVVYDNSLRVANPTWHCDSVARFEVEVTDTTTDYESAILIRNSGDYMYQNLWLFITEIAPDSTITCDTIEYYLADNYGRWLGSGIGSLYTSLYYYKEVLHYSQSGTYTYLIEQGMREDELRGITNVGIQIIKKQGVGNKE